MASQVIGTSLTPSGVSMVDAKFTSMAAGFNLPKAFIDYLLSKGMADIESVALICSSEDQLKVELFEPFAADGCNITDMGEKTVVKKFWRACRMNLPGSSGSSAGVVQTSPEDGMPDEVEKDVTKHWATAHGFVTPDNWLLCRSSQLSLWKEVSNRPPRLEVVLMESLRLASSMKKGTNASLMGQPIVWAIGDAVHGPCEVFLRARAWLITISFVGIRRPEFLPLQTAIFGGEQIMTQCLMNLKGQPPVSHLVAAWAATVHYWSEQTRVSGQKLQDFVKNTGAWLHFWTWNPGNDAVGGEGNLRPRTPLPHGPLGAVSLLADVHDEMQRLRKQSRANQAANDRLRAEMQQLVDSRNGTDGNHGGGRDYNKGGKGKNGKGKDYGKDGKGKDNGRGTRRSRSRGSGREYRAGRR